MTFGELFAGIGGFSLGLERAGMQCKWQVEIDPYAQAVLRKHWPDVPKHDDVRTFPPHTHTHDYSVDLICGGFPCQDISYAGKGAGLAGARSGLWHQFARIIGDLRPRYVLVENVAALLARGMGDVLGTLAALGYDAEWSVVAASDVGAPHRRERVWILAYAAGAGWRNSRVIEHAARAISPQGISGNQLAQASNHRCADVSDANHKGQSDVSFDDVSRGGMSEFAGGNQWWLAEPDVGRVAHGVPSRVDRLRCLGNAVVPQVVEIIGRAILEAEARMKT